MSADEVPFDERYCRQMIRQPFGKWRQCRIPGNPGDEGYCGKHSPSSKAGILAATGPERRRRERNAAIRLIQLRALVWVKLAVNATDEEILTKLREVVARVEEELKKTV